MTFNVESIPEEYQDLNNWPSFSVAHLSDERRALFNNRYHAMELYLSGRSSQEIIDATKIGSSEIVRLLNRCLIKNAEGNIYGFSALVPYSRVSYVRQKAIKKSSYTSGMSGAFSKLLNCNPVLADLIERELLKKEKSGVIKVYERKISYKKLHVKFLKKCMELGLQVSGSYPFNTENLAYNSLASYAGKLISNNGEKGAIARSGDAARAKLGTGTGSNRPLLLPYERVECDAHKVDSIFCVLIPTGFGEFIPKILHRIWVIVIQDVASRTILGYRVVYSKECNSQDVIKCVKSALTAWEKKKLRIPINYEYGALFPAKVSEKYLGAKWKEFSVDGAMANLATQIETKMLEVVGCRPEVHRRRNKDDRPFVERFFGTLSSEYFKRLPSTTGSKKEEFLRSHPELAACKYFIHIEELDQVVDVLMANYNATPHGAIGTRTPISYLQYLVSKHNIDIDRVNQDKVKTITTHSKVKVVKGSVNKGKRPYINFCYSIYSSDLLRSLFSLVGHKIIIEYDPDDIRIVTAFKVTGELIGKLVAAPPWNKIPHSVNVRTTINSLKKKKVLYFARYDDPVVAYLKFCEEKIMDGSKVMSPYLEARATFAKFINNQKLEQRELSSANDETTELKLESAKAVINSTLPEDSAKIFTVRKARNNWK